jgi:hypothetical protein
MKKHSSFTKKLAAQRQARKRRFDKPGIAPAACCESAQFNAREYR